MRLEISREALDGILAEAAGSPGIEVCGLVLGEGLRVERVVSCRNVADERVTGFEIDPQALIAAHKAARGGGPAVIGHYHSHPTGKAEPSARDAANAMGDGAIWIVASSTDVRGWVSRERGSFEPVEFIIHPGEGRGPGSGRS